MDAIEFGDAEAHKKLRDELQSLWIFVETNDKISLHHALHLRHEREKISEEEREIDFP